MGLLKVDLNLEQRVLCSVSVHKVCGVGGRQMQMGLFKVEKATQSMKQCYFMGSWMVMGVVM